MPSLVTRRDYSRLILSETGLVSYWRLGEPSGTNADDSKGANDGTYTGGYTLYQPPALVGDVDPSVALNGSTGYVAIPHSASLALAGDLTLEAWVKPVDRDTYDMVVTKGTAGTMTYELRLEIASGRPHFECAAANFTSTNAAPLGVWSYLVVTRSGTTVTHYLNGAANGSGTAAAFADDGTGARIGGRSDGHYFKGDLDEVAIYSVPLTAAQVARHYAAGRQRKNIVVGKSRSAVAVAAGRKDVTPDEIAGLKLWLKADALALADNDPVGTWTDSSGVGNDFTQATAANKPTFKTGIVNGKPVVRFDGFSADYLTGPDLMSGEAAGEIFLVVKADADPPGIDTQSGLYHFGSVESAGHFPYTDGTVFDGFGSTARKTTVDPTPSLASWRLYNVTSKAGGWTSRLDGTQIFTTATNTVGWDAAPSVGRSWPTAAVYFDGDLAEVLLYNSELSAGSRDSVEAYIATRYGLTIA